MEITVSYGLTGAGLSFGFRTDELPILECTPFHSLNGCLDAPEMIPAGSSKSFTNTAGSIQAFSSFNSRNV